ncbi:MAG: NAD(+)/NADH kinase [Chloroflexi bacterium]|nr:NAD(+)/NADH kinase [Chloroflexota bacterium]
MQGKKSIGVVYNPRSPEAEELASLISRRLSSDRAAHLCSVESERLQESIEGLSTVVTVGGDGTILRVARHAAPAGVPILGVNMGRLGFMTELRAAEALDLVPRYLEEGYARVEERAMLQAELLSAMSGPGRPPMHALNDVVVGGAVVSRMIRVRVSVDGAELAIFTADGVIVSTATGSTAYAFSAGGPILHPASRDMIVKAVVPHMSLSGAVVVAPETTVELVLLSDHQAMLSVDGHVDIPLAQHDRVRVTASPHQARFLRAHPPSYFFETLARRLNVIRETRP